MNIVTRLTSIIANAENMGIEVLNVLEDAKDELERLERDNEDLRSFLNDVAANCAWRAKK